MLPSTQMTLPLPGGSPGAGGRYHAVDPGHAYPPMQTQYPMQHHGAAAQSSAMLGPPQTMLPPGHPQAAGPPQAYSPQHGQAANAFKPLAVLAAERASVDPVMREVIKQQALHLGGHAVVAARHYGHQGLMAFQDYVQQGPQAISTLCFVGGVATSALGFMNTCNLFGTLTDPFHYILNAYLFAFGLATAVIEADTDRLGMLVSPFDRLAEPVLRSQAWLHAEVRLLTGLRGRGFFYLYQGALMVTQCILCLYFLAGLYSIVMGVLCVLTSFGFVPDFDGTMSAKMENEDHDNLDQEEAALASTLSLQAQHLPPAATVMIMDQFPRAEAAFKSHKERLPGKARRELWALHKQATVGDCNEAKPSGTFNGSAKEQWRLWNGLQGIAPEEAKLMFVERLHRDGISF